MQIEWMNTCVRLGSASHASMTYQDCIMRQGALPYTAVFEPDPKSIWAEIVPQGPKHRIWTTCMASPMPTSMVDPGNANCDNEQSYHHHNCRCHSMHCSTFGKRHNCDRRLIALTLQDMHRNMTIAYKSQASIIQCAQETRS